MTKRNNSLAGSIAMIAVVLMAIGTVFVFSAGASLIQDFDWQRFYRFAVLRRIFLFPLAVLVMLAVSCFDYRKLALRHSWFACPVSYMIGLGIVLLVVVLIPKFGTEINYARRWLRFSAGPVTVSFQPSELAKWLVILFLAVFYAREPDAGKRYLTGFLPACAVVATVVGLIVIEDFGTAAVIAFICLLMFIIAGVKFRYVLTPLPLVLAAFLAVLARSPARIERIKAFLNPHKWADSAAYQAGQSLIAIGSGGLFGKGLGRGICKYGHLPEDTTDFIFAIIGEELGFAGTAAVILMYIVFTWLGILVILRCRDRLGRLLAAGITIAIAIQAAVNIGVVTVVLPTKGIPLPFISAGGTSMLLSAAAVGILVNIAKQTGDNQLDCERMRNE